MSTFVVTDPDSGRKVRLTGDSPPTDEELEQIFASLPPVQAAPEQAAEKLRGRGIAGRQAGQRREESLAALSPEQRSLVESVGPGEAALIGAGRGLTTLARGVGLAEPEDPTSAAAIENLRASRPGAFGAGELAGQTAPFLIPGAAVAGIPGQAARVAATTALGAAEGGIITAGEGGDFEKGAGIGGLVAGTLELALPRLGRLGRQAIRRNLGREATTDIVDGAGNPSQEFVDALKVEGKSFDEVVEEVNVELADEFVEPEQIARQAFLESQGIEPTRAQISRTADDFQAQQEAAKTSTAVREQLEQQEAVLTTRFDNAVLATGGQAVTPTSTVTDSLVSKATKLDQEISNLYGAAREAAPGEKSVRFDGLAKELRRLAPSDARAGGNISSTVGDLQARGILDENMNVVGRVTVETAEEVRKDLNALFDGKNGFGNLKLREMKDAVDDDVFSAAGDDIFQQARQAKADFETELTNAKISKFDNRKTNLVRDVLENKVSPETLTNDVVFSKKYRGSDLQELKDYISTDEAGAAAFNDLRADVLNTIKERSFTGPEDALGNKALSRDRLEKSLKAIGDKKLEVLFTPEERAFFEDMLQVAKLREPVRGTALGRGPSAQAIGRIEAFLKSNPIVGSLVSLVDFDVAGRAALKAPAARRIKDITPIEPSPTRTAAALAGSAAAAPLAAEEE